MCRRYPGRKEENWWLLVGRPADNSCLVIKRVPLKQRQTSKLQFTAPEQTGQQELSLYFMCDSWNGCDQVCARLVDVGGGGGGGGGLEAWVCLRVLGQGPYIDTQWCL